MSTLGDTESVPRDREEVLDQVLADYLREVAAGRRPDRQALLAAHADLADELSEFFADQDRFKDLASPLRAAVAQTTRPLPSSIGAHEILGEIARGGMGVVLRARHRTLGRLVALKLLLAGPFADHGDVERFRREAEAVASLDHPNIVPIYEVGEHDGLPYFTMKLMRTSLSQVLRGTPPAAPSTARGKTALLDGTPSSGSGSITLAVKTPTRATLSPRDAALLVATVAGAIHHAHQRGILHRDLKPANILLDEQGLPHVSDFGLARRGDSSVLTATGTVVGTPAYMAPEQAAGKASEVTVASDVYSLGAVLYECLTGRPPFRGDNPIDTLRQVLDHEPARPRLFDPRIPLDLETICLKCLEKAPARRYASAAELAGELERWLAGEPILARRLGPATRMWRRARRQPLVAALILALLAAVLSGLSLVLCQWQHAREGHAEASRQRDEARQALARADEATRAAEASFRQAHAAVNEFCVSLGDELAHRPGLQALHRRLVHAARRYYEEFVRQRGHEPGLQRELADTHVRVAQISARVGERPQALEAYREALAIYRRLHHEKPDDVVLERKLAGTLSNFSTLQGLQEGLKTSAEALALYRRFTADHPNDLDLAAGLNLVLANRGSKLIAAGRFDDADRYLCEALVGQDRLARRYPWNDALWSELAGTLDNYGVLLARQGHRPESLCCYLRAHGLRERLARRRPDDVNRQANLAAIRHHIGLALRDLGRLDDAREAFEQALAVRRGLAEANPLVTRFQSDLAASLTNLGVTYNQERRRDQALKCFQQARRIHERLVARDATSRSARKLLAETWFNIGTTYGALKRRDAEGDALARARRLQEGLVEAEPDNAESRFELGRTLNNLGINLWVRRQEPEARRVLQEAITSTGRLVARAPGVRSYRKLLNNHHGVLAEIEWRQGNAAASVEQVLARWKLWPDDPVELFSVAREIARAAALSPGDEQQARWLDLAERALRQAVEHGFSDFRRLREDEDLKLLHGRPDFEKLLR